MQVLAEKLTAYSGFAKVIASSKPYRRLDFSSGNADLSRLDLTETAVFAEYVSGVMLENNRYLGIGGYAEDRIIYRTRKHFQQNTQPRSIHLGTDIWTTAGEPVHAPLSGQVHSFAFNNHYGDYGPTIILAHELQGARFYTLYGHLSLESLHGLYEGKEISTGECFASIGFYPENGDWPPHLHFQVIENMGEWKGDYPGVSSWQDRDYYLAACPDPNLILCIPENTYLR
ncbi:peptidoglycan DD-metalloendopeptidase family protein [Dyadobacter sandarakinus]|uniref:Peptidoglycan DD-metalloendopeptidase family protein n=2 Tax=Dyadobacter sandarakinus TaxID=2747268 RepID=A0ABX7IFQ4_9BACT|nr:peptidoglycan DD-metalloendopeptidase family protein [Dyadobacter sandarakinus]